MVLWVEGHQTGRPIVRDAVAIPALALIAGLLYVINLTVSGYANTYYAMAAQAASQSWSALFFGALDAPGFITTDKPPLATALMGLSVRAFGLSPWSILLPEALLGVGTVVVLFLAVRRSFGSNAGLIAGVLMAVSPAAVLIFRYDNPDALLTFLLVSAAWALGRGLEHGHLGWAVLAASLVGAAFLTKYLQAYLVLPGFALVWLVCAPVSLRQRVAGLVAAGLTVAITSFWWVAIVQLLPAGSRPYIGGSTTNSPLDLLLGYNGLGRLFGDDPGAGPTGTFGGILGPVRLFNDQFAGAAAWLLPAAVLALAVGIAVHVRRPRTDRPLAGYLLWGSWLTVHGLVFSFMSGNIHPYYAVILTPALAALVGGAAAELWQRLAASRWAGAAMAAGVLATGLTAWSILDRTPDFAPALGVGVLAVSAVAAFLLAIPAARSTSWTARAAIGLAAVAFLAGPLAYDADTMATAYSGGDPIPGPGAEIAFNGPVGGLSHDPVATPSLVSYLVAKAGTERWIVAASGSQVAADIQLAAGLPVMTMGGFSPESDPTPTSDELRAAIDVGEVRFVLLRYVVVDAAGGVDNLEFRGGPSGGGDPGVASDRTSWVAANCAAVSLGGSTSSGLYDCANP